MIFFCVRVMYSGEYDACDVTRSVYPHRGIELTTFGILAQCSAVCSLLFNIIYMIYLYLYIGLLCLYIFNILKIHVPCQ
jgi:hypothetical protein